MKKIKSIKFINIILIISILISIFTSIKPVNAAGTTVGISGNSTVAVGDNITLNIYISGTDTFGGAQAVQGKVVFDSEYLEYVSNATTNVFMMSELEPNANYKYGSFTTTPVSTSGQKNIHTLVFKAKKAGTTEVTMADVGVSDKSSNKVTSTISGKTITITDGSEPDNPTNPDNPNPPVTNPDDPDTPTTPDNPDNPDSPKSSDATLKSLAADGYTLSPSFSSGTTSYTVKVPANATTVKLTGAANDSKATVTGLGNITLSGDKTTATIKVTAEDGSSKTYTVNIEKETTTNEVKKDSDATLKSLDVSGYTLSPTFKSNVNTYSMKVKNNITSLNVDAIPNSDKAKVEISGNTNWQEGNNVITIKVTAEDGSTNTYIVNVNRAASSGTTTTTKSSDNYLKSLTINSSHTISPSFDKNTSSYSIEVPYEVNKLDLSAIANNSRAKVEITGNENFVVGKVNIVEIKVTAEDGSIRIYTLNVTRNAISSGTELEDIIISGGTLSPKFDPEVDKYTTTVGKGVDKLDITAIAKDKDAKVEIIGNENLKEGKNTVLIKVTDKNGYSKYYTIEVEKEADSSDGKILGLSTAQFWTLLGIVGFLLLLLLLIILLLRRKKDDENEKDYRTPIIEVKPEFNFGSKNKSDDDVVHGNLNQDSELEYDYNDDSKNYKDYEDYEDRAPYDIYDETVTKTELIDAIKEATETKDPSKLKMLLEQDELNRKKKELKKRDSEKREGNWR